MDGTEVCSRFVWENKGQTPYVCNGGIFHLMLNDDVDGAILLVMVIIITTLVLKEIE